LNRERAKTVDKLEPGKTGYVRFKGELWQARSDVIIEPRTKVVIVEKDESTLVVKPKNT
jgi:membrane-bound serine protease (ClpP class)